MDEFIYPIAAKNSILATLYYTFWSVAFYKEHQAVLKGRVAYRYNTDALLIRNIHRIEKGLISEPFRENFADRYIKETMDAFASTSINDQSYSWAADVIDKYFGETESPCTPYKRTPRHLDIDAFHDIVLHRKSVRYYTKQKVGKNKIKTAKHLASYAPSSCNRQAFRFVDTTQEHALGSDGFSYPHVIAVVGDLSWYFSDRDRHLIFIDGSLAAMTFVYALEAQGVGSCFLNAPDKPLHTNKMNKKIGLKDHERVIVFIGFGYSDYDKPVLYSGRKKL